MVLIRYNIWFLFDGGLWLGQVKLVPFSLIMSHLDTGNHHHQVIQLEPLEIWNHRGMGAGYGVFSVATCTSYTHHNVIIIIFILWILFLSVVEILIIVSGG